jgi:hypothetical protein
MAPRSKAWTAFTRLNAGIVGSNPNWLHECLCAFILFVLFCVQEAVSTDKFYKNPVNPANIYMHLQACLWPSSMPNLIKSSNQTLNTVFSKTTCCNLRFYTIRMGEAITRCEFLRSYITARNGRALRNKNLLLLPCKSSRSRYWKYLLTYGAEPFLRSCQLCSHSENSQQF